MESEGVFMNDTGNEWWEREQALRHRLLGHVKANLSDSACDTAADAFSDLLHDAHEEMVEELLSPIFEWSDYWPKLLAAEILGLSTDDEYDWEELLDAFEARERHERPEQSEQANWSKEGF